MIPNNYYESIHSPILKRWILAMKKEFDSLLEKILLNGKRPPKIKMLLVVGVFFFTINNKSDGGHELKARFMAKGFSQIYGKDYRET